MKSICPTRFLRYALIADALICTAIVMLQLNLQDLLVRQLQLPYVLLKGSGVFLIAYVALLIVLAGSKAVWKAMIGLVVIGNVGWAVGCVALATLAAPSGLSVAYLLAQAVSVLVIARFQWVGLSGSAVAATPRLTVA